MCECASVGPAVRERFVGGAAFTGSCDDRIAEVVPAESDIVVVGGGVLVAEEHQRVAAVRAVGLKTHANEDRGGRQNADVDRGE